jgi:predicted esterase
VRQVEVPTVPVERAALADLPGLNPDRIALGVVFPDALEGEPDRPILVTEVTADHYRSNIAELGEYAPAALAQGYVVLTAQAVPWPRRPESDTLMHRYVTLRAALRWLASERPGSERWPLVLAGFSGGAKIVQALAVSLMLENRRVDGVFLGGCNEDHSHVLLPLYPTVKQAFSQTAFFLSAGEDDRIAPLDSVQLVADQLRSSGVQRLRLSVHPGEHRLDAQDLSVALRWFRTQLQSDEVVK